MKEGGEEEEEVFMEGGGELWESCDMKAEGEKVGEVDE